MGPLRIVCVKKPTSPANQAAHMVDNGYYLCDPNHSNSVPAQNDPVLKDLEIADNYAVSLDRGRYFVSGPEGSFEFTPQQIAQPGSSVKSISGREILKKPIGVAQGIASVLGPLAALGTNIFGTVQRTRLEKERLKRGGGASAGPDPALLMALTQQPKGPSVGLIVGLGLFAVIALVVVVKMSKKDEG